MVVPAQKVSALCIETVKENAQLGFPVTPVGQQCTTACALQLRGILIRTCS